MPTQAVRFMRWNDVPQEQVNEMLSRRVVSGEREMVAQITLKKGCIVPEHAHESEQITYVLRGALQFRIAGQEITVHADEILHIPSHTPHAAVAVEETFELDLFSPIRQDWLDHTDDYLRR